MPTSQVTDPMKDERTRPTGNFTWVMSRSRTVEQLEKFIEERDLESEVCITQRYETNLRSVAMLWEGGIFLVDDTFFHANCDRLLKPLFKKPAGAIRELAQEVFGVVLPETEHRREVLLGAVLCELRMAGMANPDAETVFVMASKLGVAVHDLREGAKPRGSLENFRPGNAADRPTDQSRARKGSLGSLKREPGSRRQGLLHDWFRVSSGTNGAIKHKTP